MEYLPLGNLQDQHKRSPVTKIEIPKLVLQGLEALNYLHSLSDPITHRDIKPENILVQGRGTDFYIKLSDFGLSKDTPTLKTQCGMLLYLAPEIKITMVYEEDETLEHTSYYDSKVDVWSLGVVALRYLCRLPNYSPHSWCKTSPKLSGVWPLSEPTIL